MLAAALLLVPPLAGWLAADQLAHPSRRTLQDYHHEFLDNPALHGVVLKPFTCTDGTPCLMAEPDPRGQLGKRGQLIREQLLKKKLFQRQLEFFPCLIRTRVYIDILHEW